MEGVGKNTVHLPWVSAHSRGSLQRCAYNVWGRLSQRKRRTGDLVTLSSHFLLPATWLHLLQTQPAPLSRSLTPLRGLPLVPLRRGMMQIMGLLSGSPKPAAGTVHAWLSDIPSLWVASQGGNLWPFSNNSSIAPSCLPLFVFPS